MGAKSRRKGARGELELVAALLPIFPMARRGLGQTRGGQDGPDVEGCEPFWFESKRQKRPNILAALAQAIGDMGNANDPGMRWPVAVTRRDRAEPLATMRLSDFLELVHQWRKYEAAVIAQAKAVAITESGTDDKVVSNG